MQNPCSRCALSLRKANGSRGVMLKPGITPTCGHCPLQQQPCWHPPAETWHMAETSKGHQRALKGPSKSLCGDLAASAPQPVVSLSTLAQSELFCMGIKAITPPASAAERFQGLSLSQNTYVGRRIPPGFPFFAHRFLKQQLEVWE